MMVYVVQWDDKSLSFTAQLWSKNRECEGKQVWTNRATGLPLPFESTDRKGKKKIYFIGEP